MTDESTSTPRAAKTGDSPGSAEQDHVAKLKSGRRHTIRPFPASSYKEAAELAEALLQISGGAREVRRITLFDYLKRSPDSGRSRQAVTNSARYGLTTGSYKAEMLKLTDDGFAAVNPEASPRERVRAQFRLAIEGTPAFKALYERFSNNKLPTQQVMKDALVSDEGLSEADAKQAVELFIVNAREIGLLRTLSGAERILTLDHLLDLLPTVGTLQSPPITTNGTGPAGAATASATSHPAAPVADLDKTCFYITPIGDEGTDERKHSDLVLGQIVEPAIEALGLELVVVRADRLTQPGMISQQILQHVLGARIVVADLSFHNPNVFYELAIRHATGLPTVSSAVLLSVSHSTSLICASFSSI